MGAVVRRKEAFGKLIPWLLGFGAKHVQEWYLVLALFNVVIIVDMHVIYYSTANW